MHNPFEQIDNRLENLEQMIHDLRRRYILNTLSGKHQPRIVDLPGLIKARPFLGCKDTLYKKISRGELPHSKIGKRLVFDLEIIDKWIMSNSVQAPQQDDLPQRPEYLHTKRKRRRAGLQ